MINGIGGYVNAACPPPSGCLVVFNPTGHPEIPPNGTIVGVPAVKGGVLQELNGTSTTATAAVEDLEIPINEEDFFRQGHGRRPRRGAAALVGRRAAEVLGKALFWDMQVGSDGVQACGSCHFNAGVDNRTKNQRNPGVLGPLGVGATLEPLAGSQTALFNSHVVAADFPFHKRSDPTVVGDGTAVALDWPDANDAMSSMGVSRFKLFNDVPAIGPTSFMAAAVSGVRALLPDLGTVIPDPVAVNEGFRRVEPRNTPTMHGAAFNLDNFWDGRARFNYNGGSVFGPSDPQGHIFVGAGDNPSRRDECRHQARAFG